MFVALLNLRPLSWASVCLSVDGRCGNIIVLIGAHPCGSKVIH